MNVKITVAALALVCAATAGVTSSAAAGTTGVIPIAGGAGQARHYSGLATEPERSQVWKARHGRQDARWQRQGRKHARRNNRRHKRRHRRNFGFSFGLPFWAFEQRSYDYRPAPAYYDVPPLPPSWRFDGTRWVCDYYDAYGRPLCR